MHESVLIFTDLDGTLLDHYTYDTSAASDTITELNCRDIPIIFNTSKTQSEVLEIRTQFSFSHPFIVENGAAVFIPVGYFSHMPEDCKEMGGYWVKSFCHTREHWLNMLENQAHQFRGVYKGFSDFSIAELAKLTGLSEHNSAQALTREYSEPLHWLGSDESIKAVFVEYMQELGANILQGGRFMHVSGYCDKGQAQQWLIEQYQKQFPEESFLSIALGDSGNDTAMLEQADIAVQIKSPVHGFTQLTRTEKLYQSKGYGPVGWAECLTKIVLT